MVNYNYKKNTRCVNGGRCQSNPSGGYTCICTPGFTGQRCE